jgi:hypothetical protein
LSGRGTFLYEQPNSQMLTGCQVGVVCWRSAVNCAGRSSGLSSPFI